MVLLLAAGCSDASQPTRPPVVVTTSVSTTGCADASFKDPTGVYCVVVPQGYKPVAPAAAADGVASDRWTGPGGFTFAIDSWDAGRPGHTLNDVKASFEQTRAGQHLLESATLAGAGRYERLHNPETNHYSMRSVVQIGGKVVECQAEYDTPLNPNDACKTLRSQH
ncbi:hypothetical protein [Dactylosporangium matsuzakiense]|uniref:hypothetical protein n=1 Tax=Dactylosporangium matsuzakiense TaxID=53360 RepID=UPI0022F31503|nr:hypothetical protein [Dactylosporangium matsuzakiense]